MKIRRAVLALFICCLVFSSAGFAKSPVWKISKNGQHLFIGGTIHLLTESDYPLPVEFDKAYASSMLLVLEADLQKVASPEFQQVLLQSAVYPGDQTIQQFLKPGTLKTLETYLASRGIPMEAIVKFKPGILSVTLTVMELQRLGLMGTGVDEFYNSKALNGQREIRHLETVQDQLDFISKMGDGNEDAFIEYTLNDLENLPNLFESMKNAWRAGDMVRLGEVALDPWKDRFPKIYDSLLVKRNNNWIPQIVAMLETKEIEFVLFGVLHMVGEHGILKQLEALGYRIENM